MATIGLDKLYYAKSLRMKTARDLRRPGTAGKGNDCRFVR